MFRKSFHMKLNKAPRGSLGVATLSGFMLVIFLLSPFPAFASLSIDAPLTTYTIDFAGFTGIGFSPTPSAGQLDSDTWRISGLSDGDLAFGGTAIGATFTRGTSTGGVTPGGIYAFNVAPGVTALGIQPTNGEFTPGEIVLRLLNNTGGTITDLDVSYDLWVYNDQDCSTSFDLSHSGDDSAYTTLITFSTTAGKDTNGWTQQPNTTTISGLSISHGGFYYLRWSSDDAGGSGPKRDELGLTNIQVSVSIDYPPDAVDDSDTTAEDTPVTIDVLFNDSDPDGDTLLLDSFTQPTNGTVTRDDNGTPGDTSDDQLTYAPDAGWSGDDSFTYTISDEDSDTDTATVYVTVEDPYPFKLYLPLIMR
jgi:hypothetical protein